PNKLEKQFKENFESKKVTNELYEKDSLNEYITFIKNNADTRNIIVLKKDDNSESIVIDDKVIKELTNDIEIIIIYNIEKQKKKKKIKKKKRSKKIKKLKDKLEKQEQQTKYLEKMCAQNNININNNSNNINNINIQLVAFGQEDLESKIKRIYAQKC